MKNWLYYVMFAPVLLLIIIALVFIFLIQGLTDYWERDYFAKNS